MGDGRRQSGELTTREIGTLQWWTVRELANRYRVSADTMIRIIERGEIKGRKVGGQWRVHNTAVEKYDREGKPREAPPANTAVAVNGDDPWRLYSETPSTGRNR